MKLTSKFRAVNTPGYQKPEMIIGARVSERMRAAGISQAELARRVGVSQPTIFKLIHTSKKGSAHLHRVARELGTTPAYLSGETDNPDSDGPDEEVLSSDARELLAAFDQLPIRDRRALVQIATSLAAANDTAPSLHDKRQDYRGRGDR